MANLVQVLGPGRTGTTMMHLMLANAPDAFACGEIYAFFRPFRTHHFRPACACARQFAECSWRDFDAVAESRFHAALAERNSLRWIVDESKPLRWIVDSHRWARHQDMRVFSVLMMKEPVGLMFSHWKRGRPVADAMRVYANYYARFLRLGVPFVSVSLEQLAADPAGKLRQICDAIGMEYFDGKERFWEKQHCHLFGSLGLRKQIEAGKMAFRAEPPYPQEFLDLAEPHLQRFRSDASLSKIHSLLKDREVANAIQLDGNPPAIGRLALGPWYYADWLLSAYRKRFPQAWQHAQ